MNYILEVASYSTILPLIPAVARFKSYTAELRIICIYVFIGAATEIISRFLWTKGVNNLPLLHLYVAANFTALFFFYKKVLGNLVKNWVWYAVAIFFYSFAALDSFWLQGLYTFNSYTLNLEDGIMIVFAILCFYKISTELKVRQLERYPIFWINTGLLFYYSGSLLIFTLSNETVSFSKIVRTYLWSVHALFIILMYVLISIGLWVYRRNKISTT